MNLSAQQAYDLLQSRVDLTIIDVRTSEEYEMFLIEGAVNIDISLEIFEQEIMLLDRNNAYLIHCHSGERSEKAFALLQQWGFTEIFHLDGGIREWAFQEFPHIYNHSL